MSNEKIIKVKIFGSDYSSINDASISFFDCDNKQIDIYDGQNSESNDNIIDKKIFTRNTDFIEVLLKYIAPNGKIKNPEQFFINVREWDNSKKDIWAYTNTYRNNNNKILFQGVVGVIKFRVAKSELYKILSVEDELKLDSKTTIVYDVTLEIQTRFDRYERNSSVFKPYFLSTLLLRDKIKLTDATVPLDEDSIYDYLLLFWFKEHFSNAIQKGLYRAYRRFERNDDKLKGTIDVARHIKLNAGQKNGKIAYSFREYTIDNYINYLIVKAYECLKRKHYDLVIENFDDDIELKSTIDLLKNQISNYDLNDNYLIAKSIKQIAHPYYSEYEELRKVCVKILRDEGITIFDASTDADIRGILFYVPDLWEMYLESKFDEVSKIYYEYQKRKETFGILSYKNDFYYRQSTYPDYLFGLNDNKRIVAVLDAKFKPAWSEIMISGKIGNSYLPDYDKCIRDMIVNGCLATGVIFPSNSRDIELANEEMNNLQVNNDIEELETLCIRSIFTQFLQLQWIKYFILYQYSFLIQKTVMMSGKRFLMKK